MILLHFPAYTCACLRSLGLGLCIAGFINSLAQTRAVKIENIAKLFIPKGVGCICAGASNMYCLILL